MREQALRQLQVLARVAARAVVVARAVVTAILLFACMTVTYAASHATIEAAHPGLDATLGRNGTFYVRIAYESDEPISLWARPYRNGKEVKNAMSNASARRSGAGQALGWFALNSPGYVDEVRLRAGGGDPYREWELARTAVRLEWTAADVPEDASPRWVAELKAAEEARSRAEAERRANEPLTGGDVAFMSGFMLVMLALGVGGIVVPLWSAWRWQGGWRIAALVPVAVLGFVALRIVVDTARDPTSHNLWPFEIITFGGGALLAVGVLWLARRLIGVHA
jgi:hypothetical protein